MAPGVLGGREGLRQTVLPVLVWATARSRPPRHLGSPELVLPGALRCSWPLRILSPRATRGIASHRAEPGQAGPSPTPGRCIVLLVTPISPGPEESLPLTPFSSPLLLEAKPQRTSARFPCLGPIPPSAGSKISLLGANPGGMSIKAPPLPATGGRSLRLSEQDACPRTLRALVCVTRS